MAEPRLNERIDSFSGNRLKAWHGVGVFFLKDGKIVECYVYTISIDRGEQRFPSRAVSAWVEPVARRHLSY